MNRVVFLLSAICAIETLAFIPSYDSFYNYFCESPFRNYGYDYGCFGCYGFTPLPANISQDCLDRHNYYRAKHNSAPLTLSDSLNSAAQEMASQIACNHYSTVGSSEIPPFGINVFATNQLGNGSDPVDFWYKENEEYKYDEDTPSNLGYVERFTQLVWKGTKELGVGSAVSPDGCEYVVCLYKPIGNEKGKFKDNVEKPSDAPVKPSDAPEKPSNAPEKPSDAPVKPSDAPEKPSDAPEKPSDAPEKKEDSPKP